MENFKTNLTEKDIKLYRKYVLYILSGKEKSCLFIRLVGEPFCGKSEFIKELFKNDNINICYKSEILDDIKEIDNQYKDNNLYVLSHKKWTGTDKEREFISALSKKNIVVVFENNLKDYIPEFIEDADNDTSSFYIEIKNK